MPTCPAGHDSTDPDFCEVCGMRIGGAVSAQAPSAASAPVSAAGPAAADTPAEPCPQCGTARSGQFCEGCGYDFTSGKAPSAPAPAPPAAGAAQNGPAPGTAAPAGQDPAGAGPAGPGPGGAGVGAGDGSAPSSPVTVWTAVVTADRAYFDSVIAEGGPDAASIEFPGYCPERRFRLAGREMRIGRRSVSRGLEPEIDLTGPPADPGVSHMHAVLTAEPDGTWAVLDPGSSNGTMVNGGEVVPGVHVPLHDGDRISLGAWTVLTIRAVSGR